MISINNKLFDEPLTIDNETLLTVVIEDKKTYRYFLNSLKNQLLNDTEEFELYYDGQMKLFNKYVYLISDPLFFELDDKKTNSFIQKETVSSLTEEQIYNYKDIIRSINDWIKEATINLDFSVEYSEEMDIATFLKSFNLRISKSINKDVELFLKNIKILSFVTKAKIFFITNLHQFFDKNELEIILKELLLNDIRVVSVESSLIFEKSSKDHFILIDKDLAELHINFE